MGGTSNQYPKLTQRMRRVLIRGMGDFLDKLPGLEGVVKAARQPLSLAALLMILAFLVLAYVVPDSLMEAMPHWLMPTIILLFIGTVIAAFLRIVWVSVKAPEGDGKEFREFLAKENPDLLAQWILRKSGTETANNTEQVSQVADAITALTEIEDAPPHMLTLALEKLEEGSTDAAEKLFEMVAERDDLLDDHQFEALRHLGTLKFLHDTAGAEQAFTTALKIRPDDMDMLNRLAHVHHRTGDLAKAEAHYQKVLILAQQADDSANQAVALGNLGVLYYTKGELDEAEEIFRKSLTINEALGHKEGMASDYGNLGNLYRAKGELDEAEEMFRKSLAIEEALGRKEGMAADYGNLGSLYRTKGELDKAEEMYRKAITINESLGHKEGMAINYGNLGSLYDTRGELDEAEEMYRKALTINEALDRKEGMAANYGNLGNLYRTKGELDKAEEMYRKSLTIDEALGHKEGMAANYSNLGSLFEKKDDTASAREYWQKARQLYTEIGMPHMAERVEGWLAAADAKEEPQD